MIAIPTDVWKLGPVQLVHPDGYRESRGYGLSSAAAIGDQLLALQNKATSGMRIEVYSDATIDAALGKNGVNWWFASVDVINATTDIWSDGGAAMTFEVAGDAKFHNTSTNGNNTARICNVSGASSVIFRCRSAESDTGVAFRTNNAAADLVIYTDYTQSADGTFDNVGGDITIFGRRAFSEANYVLENDGGDVICHLAEIESGGAAPIGQASGNLIACYGTNIIAPSGRVAAENGVGPTGLLLVNCTIDCTEQDCVDVFAQVINTHRTDGSSLGAGITYLDTLQGTTPTTAGLALLDDADAAAQRATLAAGAQAPVIRISPDGTQTPYGFGAANAAAVGTALLAAQTAASSGDIIECHADATISSSLGKSGVRYRFDPVTVTGASGVTIWNVSTGISFIVQGLAAFVATGDANAVYQTHASADVTICGRRFQSANNGFAAVFVSAGQLRVEALEDITALNYDAIWIDGGTLDLVADALTGGDNSIEVTNGVSTPTLRAFVRETSGPSGIALGESNTYLTIWQRMLDDLSIDSSDLVGFLNCPAIGTVSGSAAGFRVWPTTAGLALLDDTDATAQRATLGVAGAVRFNSGATSTFNPTDGNTYYVGEPLGTFGPGTTTSHRQVYLPACKITGVKGSFFAANAGVSNEDVTFYVRVNDTSDTLIGTAAFSATAFATTTFSNTSIDITINEGDYVEIKMVCPTWTTNPTGVDVWGSIFIQ